MNGAVVDELDMLLDARIAVYPLMGLVESAHGLRDPPGRERRMNRSTAEAGAPASASTRRTAVSMPWSRSFGVEGTLVRTRRPSPSRATMSMKVPPMSTPICKGCGCLGPPPDSSARAIAGARALAPRNVSTLRDYRILGLIGPRRHGVAVARHPLDGTASSRAQAAGFASEIAVTIAPGRASTK